MITKAKSPVVTPRQIEVLDYIEKRIDSGETPP